jgi:exonuclease SbcC
MSNVNKKKGELDKYIEEEIVKLSFDQFKKILMLAQGSFSEFIKSSSDDKSKLLTKIFGTTFFDKLESNLLREKVSFESECKSAKQEIINDVLNFEYPCEIFEK